jgi:U3 small nucleolar RNA-associated protein 4
VAISRQGGSVELRSARQKFRTLATVAGWSAAAIHTMAWTRHGSLVGATADGSLVVIDFQRGHFRNVTPSGGGQIHALDSFASHHGDVTCSTLVAAACEDGSVRFFDVDVQKEDDMNPPMPVVSTIPSTGAPILSLALNRFATVSKEKSSGSPLVGATVFAGVVDGTIRRYDCVQGSSWRSILRITVENLGRSIPTRVWVLKSLQDGTLVSGDSLGHVQMWDGHSGTLEATFNQNEIKADVLSLDLTRDENKLFASGVDSRVICIERSAVATEDRKWIFANAQRPHTHDVQAVAVCYRSRKKGSGGSEILCTGGIDTKLCTFAVNDFQRQRPHTLFPWPVRSPIVIAPERRVISIMRKDCIQIYSLTPRPDASLESRLQVTETDTLLGTVQIESPFNLSISTISADGKFLVVGNPSNVLLFRLTYKSGQGSAKAHIRPERLPFELPSQTTIVAAKFIRNDRLILCSTDREVHIVNVGQGEKKLPHASIQSTISFELDDTDVPSMLPHDEIVCSTDGKWFSIMRTSPEKGSVQVFKDIDGTVGHWWSIPELDDPPAAVAFLHTDHPQLVVVCSSFAPYVFDLEGRSLSTWSKGVPFPVGESLPLSFSNRKDFPVRIAVDPAAPTQFLVVSLRF